jgi:thiol-disulfide isomerase/thioredoxin
MLAALILAFAAGVAGFYAYRSLSPETPETVGPPIPAPDFVLKDLDGQPHRLSEFRGKLLLVNFWATWCGPCLKEMPLLVRAQEQYGKLGFQVIGPALDEADAVRAMAKKIGVNYPIMVGDDDIVAAMDTLGDKLGALPFSVLVARDGRILSRVTGGFTQEKLTRLIAAELSAQP